MKDSILRKLLFGNGSSVPNKVFPCDYEIGMDKNGRKYDGFMSSKGAIYTLIQRIKDLESKIEFLNDKIERKEESKRK